jgi:hypothetical protein
MFIVHPKSGKLQKGCFVLAKTVTGHGLPLSSDRSVSRGLSGFHMAWTLLIKLNYGRKPCSLIVLTLRTAI